ncbi:MAG: AAA family ATPase [Epulopiscium sp. Nele67-Bin004]|nr:MAG: AAA family ATPase [Epulopiscium sp. Nele67-Bin004]
MEVEINGIIENVIFQNEENGYTVCTITHEKETISCVGAMPGIQPGEEVEIVGVWATHNLYGKQLKVNSYTKNLPKTVQGIEKYLGSGSIKGVGEKLANRIVKQFGLDTLKIIETEPIRLAQVTGISKNKALNIGEQFHNQYELRVAILALQEFGITTTYAVKIYDKYGSGCVEVIKNNPYKLAEDIIGIGFKRADEIASHIGIEKNDLNNKRAGTLYTLNEFATNGHTYCPKDTLMIECRNLLEVPTDLVEHALLDLNIEKHITIKTYDEQVAIFLKYYYKYEENIAYRLIQLSSIQQANLKKDFDVQLMQTEKDLGISLVKEQKEAIKCVLENGVSIITGGPGTGKTTTINALLHMLKKQRIEFMLGAPTGRAAKRMSETTGELAQTIHRLLEINFVKEGQNRQYFNRGKDNPLETDILILDEVSMVDVNLMNAILNALVEGQKMVLIGDVDQLPSVGPGNVLKDIISSEKIPVVKLTQIFRQASQSAIIRNAHKINKGEHPISNEKDSDFFFLKRQFADDVKDGIVHLITERLPKYKSLDIIRDIQVLAPMRKGVLGITELNKGLQQALNPPAANKPEHEYRQNIFRKGDKVMQIKNNYNTTWKVYGPTKMPIDEGNGVFNGDCGIIVDINLEKEKLIVVFDDNKTIEYEFNMLDELELAYAITIHKSQGSEYPVVIIPIHSGPPMLLTRNLLYTAVTRAKEMVVGIGIVDTMNKMVDNNCEIKRYTSLRRQLISIL